MIAEYDTDDEYYGPWFICPYCKNKDIIDDSKFCNQCGMKIECNTPKHWKNEP